MTFHISEIIIETHKSLTRNKSNHKSKRILYRKIIFFDVFPLILGTILFLLGNSIFSNENLVSYLLTTYSIFSALLFSLIIVIVDKAKKLKETLSLESQENIQYLKRYLLFSKNLITRISFTIVLSLILIFLLLLGTIEFSGLKKFVCDISRFIEIWAVVVSMLVFYFSTQFFILIFQIVSSMYSVFIEELERKQRK